MIINGDTIIGFTPKQTRKLAIKLKEGEKYKKRSKLGIDKGGEGRSKKKSERRKEGLNSRI